MSLTTFGILTRSQSAQLELIQALRTKGMKKTNALYQKIITIDGHAGTGKTTAAKGVAEALKFIYVDTGAMYRCFTHFVLKHHVDIKDPTAVAQALKNFTFEVKQQGNDKLYFVEGEDVSARIRDLEVTSNVSNVAKIDAVREKLVDWQRKAAEGNNAVFEGRDMGTVVFPNDATLKIYLTARNDVRAHRRYKEMKEKDPNCKITEGELKAQIRKRDLIDSRRKNSPTRKALDAIEIKTGNLTPQQVIDTIVTLFKGIK